MENTLSMGRPPTEDRLRQLCEDAAHGSFPAPDWSLEFVPRPPRLLGAIVAFTAHHVLAADIASDEFVAQLEEEDIAAPFNPSSLRWLGQRLGGRVGHVDVVLARLGTGSGGEGLRPVENPADNERVRRAKLQRTGVAYFEPPGGGAVVTLGRGLCDRLELSLEVADETRRGIGIGRRLVEAAVAAVEPEQAVFASVSAGNSRSMRCFLGADFFPIGAECLFTRLRP
jgi:GNAT superfamily N-acetyltransferase